MRNVLMIATGNAGTAYYRLYNWWVGAHRTNKAGMHVLGWDRKELDAAPWQFQIADPFHQARLFGMLFQAALEADVIVIQRVETEEALTTMYALRDQFPDKPILSEIDDDITDIAPYNQAAEGIKPGSQHVAMALAQFQNSDGLIVSTPYLKEVYSEYCNHIYVVPNSIDLPKWDKCQRKRRGGIRIGWMGGTTHSEDLMLLENVIPEVCKLNRDVKFVFSSTDIPSPLKKIPGVEVVKKWVPIMDYPRHMVALDYDIGVAPLVDNKFNRAKSNLRWLEFSAMGVPSVCSKVGHFAETVRHGEDGFLAKDAAEFIAYLQLLVENTKLRKQIGKNAHSRIYKDFNIDTNVDLYLEAVEDVLTRPVQTAPSIITGVDDMKGVIDQDVPGVELSPLEVTPP